MIQSTTACHTKAIEKSIRTLIKEYKKISVCTMAPNKSFIAII